MNTNGEKFETRLFLTLNNLFYISYILSKPKTMKAITLSALILVFISCKNEGRLIDIIDLRDDARPSLQAENRQDKDVQVYRALGISEGYIVQMYRNNQGQLQGYQGEILTPDDFNKATYMWENDSTISVTLNNTSDDNSFSFFLSGYGTTTKLDIPSEE